MAIRPHESCAAYAVSCAREFSRAGRDARGARARPELVCAIPNEFAGSWVLRVRSERERIKLLHYQRRGCGEYGCVWGVPNVYVAERIVHGRVVGCLVALGVQIQCDVARICEYC